MAGLFDKQAKDYLESRPTYPASWFSMLASLTANHQLAWDVGAGNGQASVSIAEHYDRVIATDTSKEQLELAQKHPKVKYALTAPVLTDEELCSIVGEEGSVDLVTVAMAVHWFDLETFYSQVKRVLRKPGGVIAVWGYLNPSVSPAVDALYKDFFESTMPYWNPKISRDTGRCLSPSSRCWKMGRVHRGIPWKRQRCRDKCHWMNIWDCSNLGLQ